MKTSFVWFCFVIWDKSSAGVKRQVLPRPRVVKKFALALQLWSTELNQKWNTTKLISEWNLKFSVDQIFSAIFKNKFFQDQLCFIEEIPSLLKLMKKKTSCCFHWSICNISAFRCCWQKWREWREKNRQWLHYSSQDRKLLCRTQCLLLHNVEVSWSHLHSTLHAHRI